MHILTRMTVVAVALLAVVGAPIASADEGMYLDEVRQKVRAPLTDAQALQLGQVACNAIREGVKSGLSLGSSRAKADDAVGRAQHDLGLSLSMPDGMFLVEAAGHQLC